MTHHCALCDSPRDTATAYCAACEETTPSWQREPDPEPRDWREELADVQWAERIRM